MTTQSAKAVKEWRKNTKLKLITCMGSKCQICNYNKSQNALEFHHINPDEKDFSISSVRANPTSWKTISIELQKCILLCSNCHKEVHEGITSLPQTYQIFDESLLTEHSHLLKETKTTYCPVCNKIKENRNITCSIECGSKRKNSINWESIDLLDLIDVQKKTKVSIAESLGCSKASILKQYNKLKNTEFTNSSTQE